MLMLHLGHNLYPAAGHARVSSAAIPDMILSIIWTDPWQAMRSMVAFSFSARLGLHPRQTPELAS